MIRPRGEPGFTLIEVLVALALSALVSVILQNGIRLAASGLDRHTRQADRLDRRQSADEILRRTLGSAALIPRSAGGEFIGTPDDVEFLGVAEDAGPGLYRISLSVDRARADRPLILRRQLAAAAGDPRAAASVLAGNVRAFRLAYFGADGANAEPAWHDRWESLSVLPLMLRVTLDSDGDPPRPALLIRLWNAG
jgi:prepilin-type N-terminal cleavage/methylation domain-containing protein